MTLTNDVDLAALLQSVRGCDICKDLPLGPKPILQASANAKILIVGQAPGRITHEKGIPFDDPSGKRLRQWLGVSSETFYNPDKIGILPMGFCFPGTGKSGDLPPRAECAPAWREALLSHFSQLEITLIIGQYAIDWHVRDGRKVTLTQRVSEWKTIFPSKLILPHPSPRNNRWLKRNPWFEAEVIPALQEKTKEILGGGA